MLLAGIDLLHRSVSASIGPAMESTSGIKITGPPSILKTPRA
jgi:hypothetical protein